MRRAFWAALALFLYIIISNGWVIDDAYITFRTVDNILNGYGPRWNVDERVQAYSHPLWMLLVTFVAFVTREVFYSTLALSFALSVAAVLIAATFVSRQAAWKGPLLILAILCSKAVIDYTSSGLETPLAYLIAVIFLVSMLSDRPEDTKLRDAVLCASVSFLTRPDSVVLYVPAIAYLFWRTRRVGTVLLASLPAIVWVMFSLIYYGFPLPNTVYAKNLGADFPSSWILRRGLDYFGNSLLWDTAGYGVLLMAVVLSVRRRAARAVMLGTLCYVALVILGLASTTHMSGRHFAIPLFIAIVTAVHLLNDRRVALASAAILSAYFVWNPVSPVKFGTSFYVPHPQYWSYLDTKFFAYKEGAALLNWRPGRRLPDHQWYRYGEQMKASSKRVFVGVGDPEWNGVPGVAAGEPIGFAGFAAGPEKFIIDVVALSDPLLARLPAIRPAAYEDWKSGHFHRAIPKGYVESVTHRGNMIEDPGIREYYNALLTITRGPIWSIRRFKEIARINLGLYDLEGPFRR